MIANYNTVRDTLFGKLLGCALGQVVKARLASGTVDELNMNELDVTMTLNGVDVNLNQLFSALDNAVDEPSDPESSDVSDVGLFLEALSADLNDKAREISEQFGEAIGAASSSYFCGEYASESAYEAGQEHNPGDEFLYDVTQRIDSMVATLAERSSEANAA